MWPGGPGGWQNPSVGPGPGPGPTVPTSPQQMELAAKSDLAFHFNARFNERSKKVIVRNSFIAKKWGKEERDLEHFPFIQGQPFEMKILCTNKEFKVAVNKSHLLDFKHRITNLSSVDTLSIFFDLTLSSVNMETIP
uniref:Galectin n=1 Tax=Oryzias sinensis TaxID=183150 RepID=A0A8C8DWY7_9TELE